MGAFRYWLWSGFTLIVSIFSNRIEAVILSTAKFIWLDIRLFITILIAGSTAVLLLGFAWLNQNNRKETLKLIKPE